MTAVERVIATCPSCGAEFTMPSSRQPLDLRLFYVRCGWCAWGGLIRYWRELV